MPIAIVPDYMYLANCSDMHMGCTMSSVYILYVLSPILIKYRLTNKPTTSKQTRTNFDHNHNFVIEIILLAPIILLSWLYALTCTRSRVDLHVTWDNQLLRYDCDHQDYENISEKRATQRERPEKQRGGTGICEFFLKFFLLQSIPTLTMLTVDMVTTGRWR